MSQEKEESASRTLLVNVLLLVIGLGVAYGIYLGLEFGYSTDAPLRVVISDSMYPKYNVGDVVVVHGVGPQAINLLYFFNIPSSGVDPATLQNGTDIIFWYPPYSNTDPIVHEIIKIQSNPLLCGTGAPLQFTTHGIHNPTGTNEVFCESAIIGYVTGSVPYLGNVSLFLKSTVGLILIITLIGILLAIEILAPEQEEEPKQSRRTRQSRP